MWVGVLEVTLRLEGNSSLKAKRKVVKSLLGLVKARFNAAAAETARQDVHETAVLGFAVCGPERLILNRVLDDILNFVESRADAEIIGSAADFELFFD